MNPSLIPSPEGCMPPDIDELMDETTTLNPIASGNGAGGALYAQGRHCVLDLLRQVSQGGLPNLESAVDTVEELISSIRNGPELLLSATVRDQEFSLNAHCVNVTVIAIKIAQVLGYDLPRLVSVGTAALLHEIGMVKLPEGLLHKPGTLPREELALMHRRPSYSAQILRQMSPGSGLVQMVGQTYEREDGTGWPDGLWGTQICEEAKIIGVADFFEAMIHCRPYRSPLTGYECFHTLTHDQKGQFAPRVVKALIRSVSIYPYHEFVLLNTDQIGQVVGIHSSSPFRPILSILYNEQGIKLDEPGLLDLTEHPCVVVAKALTGVGGNQMVTSDTDAFAAA